MLTTTQASALVELRRHGSLHPSSRAFGGPNGRRAFARRTLQALVDAGHAEWRLSVRGTRNGPQAYDGFIMPKDRPQPPAAFKTGYLDKALDDLEGVLETAKAELEGANFDTLVGTGFSGALVVPALALRLGKQFALVRKPKDGSHHSGRMIGHLGQRWIFVDDFVSSGATRRRVIDAVMVCASEKLHATDHVGDYLYANYQNRFQPSEEI